MCTTATDSFVKRNAQPIQCIDDVFLRSGNKALGVGVFDAENEVAMVLFGKQVIVQGSTDSADVKRAGRTRGKAYPYTFGFGHIRMDCVSFQPAKVRFFKNFICTFMNKHHPYEKEEIQGGFIPEPYKNRVFRHGGNFDRAVIS
jgi:hypothetical protein